MTPIAIALALVVCRSDTTRVSPSLTKYRSPRSVSRYMTRSLARAVARSAEKSAAFTLKSSKDATFSSSRLRPAISTIWRAVSVPSRNTGAPSISVTARYTWSSSFDTIGAPRRVCTACTRTRANVCLSIHNVPR